MHKKKINGGIFSIAIIIHLCFTPWLANAQMFSVDNTKRDIYKPTVGIYAGLEPIQFKYQGDNSVGSGANIYSFKGSVIRLLLESRGINFYIGTGGNVTGLNNNSYFDAGIKAGLGLPIFQAPHVLIQIPLQLHSSYTRVSNDEVVVAATAPEFQQGTFEAGTGVDLNADLGRQFRLGANVIPSYGFTFSTRERNASGSIFAVEGKFRLYFDHLFGSAGLSLGYNYNFRQYSIEGQVLDYNATANSFLVGITF